MSQMPSNQKYELQPQVVVIDGSDERAIGDSAAVAATRAGFGIHVLAAGETFGDNRSDFAAIIAHHAAPGLRELLDATVDVPAAIVTTDSDCTTLADIGCMPGEQRTVICGVDPAVDMIITLEEWLGTLIASS